MKALLSAALALTAVALAGCTVHQTPAPGLTGPSDLALSMHVTALPDSINQDGGSQASIQVTAIGPDGKPLAALPLRMDMFVNGVGQDYGTLSARTIVTNANGVATVVYTAPPSPAGGLFGTCRGLPGNCVTIVATASGLGFETVAPQVVTIRLVPPGVILPPASTPTAQFTFSPATPAANAAVAFDASASCAGQAGTTGGCVASNNTLTGFSWTFGDGQTGSGQTLSHSYGSAGTYNVTLTVTNDRGLTASATKQVTVGVGAGPTAAFVFSPTPVLVNVQTFFDASASTPGAGHTIASYTWNWGDGAPIETRGASTNSHSFATAGSYVVVLTVADDTGQKNASSQPVTVTSPAGGIPGAPIANFTSSPTSPVVNEAVVFDSSSSTVAAGRTITDYAWNFGDDTPIIHGNNRIISHTYARPGNFIVNLVLTDSTGLTGQKSAGVSVGAGNPVAILTVFKTGGLSVQGDGSASTSSGTSTIVTYTFFWGDGTSTSGAASSAARTYGVAGTYTVTLRVTDSVGRTGTSAPQAVTVP
jgi:PKD repeat protein